MRVPRNEIPYLTQALNNIDWANHLTYNDVSNNCHVFTTVIQDTMATFAKKKSK